MTKTTTRTVSLNDAARVKAALLAAGVRYAVQIDAEVAHLIYSLDDARVAADTITAELSR